jgi:hypothetical protein
LFTVWRSHRDPRGALSAAPRVARAHAHRAAEAYARRTAGTVSGKYAY